jgi:hypothetical protein
MEGIYENILLATKPLDLINSIEYLHKFEKLPGNNLIIIIGNDNRQKQVVKLCDILNLNYVLIDDNDYYSRKISHYDTTNKSIVSELTYKTIIKIISYFKYFSFYFKTKKVNKNLYTNTICFDLGRRKILLANTIKFEELILIDGGESTITYDLIKSWKNDSVEDVIKKYLFQQKVKLPYYLVRKFLSHVRTKNTKLFSAYLNKKITDQHTIQNKYEFFIEKTQRAIKCERIDILGYPLFAGLDKQLKVVDEIRQTVNITNVNYYIHPADISRLGSISKAKQLLISKRGSGLTYVTSKISYELDILYNNKFASYVVCYNSSATKILKHCFDKKLNIYEVDVYEDYLLEERRRKVEN